MRIAKLNLKVKKRNWFFKLKRQHKIEQSKVTFFSKMQTLGKTFMLPIALLSFCGIFLGIGASLTSSNTIKQIPFFGYDGIYHIFLFIKTIGAIGFTFLPFLFVMAIPLGLASNNKGVAALSGFVAYLSLLVVTNFMIKVLPENLVGSNGYIGKSGAMQDIIGIKAIDFGVLGAILSGLLVFWIHEKTQYIKLPSSIGFWGGTRFVPIASILLFSVIAIPLVFIWPGINLGINYIGYGVKEIGVFGPFIYRFTEVLVKPTGLHHVINQIVRTTAVGGGPVTINGTEYVGALQIFFAQLNNGIRPTANVTRFLSQGFMPVVMFGLPAAGIAIYFSADREERKMVKSVIIPGIVASAVGGITEPIEFLFLFIAPLLYFVHAVLVGLSYLIVALLAVRIGNTDGNIIDFIIFGLMQGLYTRWYLVLVVGFIYAAIYYVLFYYWIKWKDLATVGRKGQVIKEQTKTTQINKLNLKQSNKKVSGANNTVAAKYLQLLGGKENIKILDNCFTRLRITLNNHVDISDQDVKNLGAIGLKIIDSVTIQIIIGTQVESLKNEIQKEIQNND